MKSRETPSLPPTAHAAGKEVRSIVANVRTSRRKPPKDASIEIRVEATLKVEASGKAKAEKTTVTKILTRALRDYVAGSLWVRRQRYGHGARQMQAAELRHGQVIITNILSDILNIAQQEVDSPLKSAACHALLKECVVQNRRQLERLF
ncbi:hypothetical protein [Lacunisphaera limnophila]|uniref:hypothetical protein n=1 Tax=Lacunisphaera limnophila TaxID=1838286 RepID=UPI0012FE4D6C|nr:hypothetical protein [Lacunisphaera limnophila]